jgi:Cu+-exporting ATPase
MPKMKDPVCGIEMDPGQVEAQSSYNGQQYNFCSAECKRLFDENPEQYIGLDSEGAGDTSPPLPR